MAYPIETPHLSEDQMAITERQEENRLMKHSGEKSCKCSNPVTEPNRTNCAESIQPDSPEKSEASAEGAPRMHDEQQHETGLKLFAICASLALALFCTALDNTIVATAIPRITDQFHSIADTSWYGSAYLLSTCSFQVFYAKIYTTYNIKWSFLLAFFTFEIGSLISAVAPSSSALIVGRATAGLGAAGIFTGALTVIAHISPLHLRPTIIGIITGLYPFCNVVGPLLGGAFTDGPGWRWCFYINLPIGGVVALIIVGLLRIRKSPTKIEGSVIDRLAHFDPIGNLLFIGAVICCLLAVQWGGNQYAFSDARIIVLFTLFGLFFACFIVSQAVERKNATIPKRVSKARTIRFSALYGFCIGGSVFIVIYYLPIYFQAVEGDTAVASAVHTLPMIISQLLGNILTGVLTTRIGHYMPFVCTACVLIPIGSGLFTTFSVGMPIGKWIGYEIIYGLGVGSGFQQVAVAVQAAFPLKDIPTGVAVVLSAQQLGGSLMLSAAETVFSSHLRSNIARLNLPDFDPDSIAKIGVTQLNNIVPVQFLPAVLLAYDHAITKAFQISMVLGCLMTLGACGMEWRSLKKDKEDKKEPSADAKV